MKNWIRKENMRFEKNIVIAIFSVMVVLGMHFASVNDISRSLISMCGALIFLFLNNEVNFLELKK